jgi:hypothetical protein
LLIRLPDDKFVVYSNDLIQITGINTWISNIKAASLCGELESVAYMIPMAFPFLNNIRRLYDGSKSDHAKRKLRQHHRDDAANLQKILDLAHRGIDMHKRVDCFPDCLALADLCPYGMGGYSINSGVAWHFDFPVDSNFTDMNNLLELLAQAVSILLELEQW